MTRLRSLAWVAVIVLLTAAGLHVALRGRAAPWLRIQASTTPVPGQPFEATVTLSAPELEAGAFVTFDLHGRDLSNTSVGYVAGGGSQQVAASTPSYRFTLSIPERHDLKSVHAVVYLSPTGRWRSHYRVARSEPLLLQSLPRSEAPFVLRAFDSTDEPAVDVPHPLAHRLSLAAVWLMCAFLAWRRTPPMPRRGLPWLAGAFLLFATLQSTDILATLADTARSAAKARGWYEERRGLQEAATFAVVCGLAALATLSARHHRTHIPLLVVVGSALFLAVEGAGMLSLHEIDRVLAQPVGPLVLDTVLRGVGAALALFGMVRRGPAPL